MGVVDIAIVVVLAVSLLIGLFRGFIREILSLFSWLGAIWIAYNFATEAAGYLEPFIDQPPLRVVAGFAGIFITALISFSIVSYLLYRLLSIAGVSGIDRSLGSLFGLIRGLVIVAVLILAANFMDFSTQPWWKDSLLVVYFDPITEFIRSLLPAEIAKYVKPGLV
jgi:membrane protein required for colicin V production